MTEPVPLEAPMSAGLLLLLLLLRLTALPPSLPPAPKVTLTADRERGLPLAINSALPLLPWNTASGGAAFEDMPGGIGGAACEDMPGGIGDNRGDRGLACPTPAAPPTAPEVPPADAPAAAPASSCEAVSKLRSASA